MKPFTQWFNLIVSLLFSKTLIKATYLIDDRPLIRGIAVPEWEHILFDQPYNWDVKQKRFTWGDNFDVLYV